MTFSGDSQETLCLGGDSQEMLCLGGDSQETLLIMISDNTAVGASDGCPTIHVFMPNRCSVSVQKTTCRVEGGCGCTTLGIPD